jgi:hypothetical protein
MRTPLTLNLVQPRSPAGGAGASVGRQGSMKPGAAITREELFQRGMVEI